MGWRQELSWVQSEQCLTPVDVCWMLNNNSDHVIMIPSSLGREYKIAWNFPVTGSTAQKHPEVNLKILSDSNHFSHKLGVIVRLIASFTVWFVSLCLNLPGMEERYCALLINNLKNRWGWARNPTSSPGQCLSPRFPHPVFFSNCFSCSKVNYYHMSSI